MIEEKIETIAASGALLEMKTLSFVPAESELESLAADQIKQTNVESNILPVPPIIMLHDALGSIEHWKDFPALVAAKTKRQVIVYSREGSGRSSNFREKRGYRYLHIEAEEILPQIFQHLRINQAVLFGHSDGASIALLFAAGFPQFCHGLIVSAPHLFLEQITLDGIKHADQNAREEIIAKMERYHNNSRDLYFAWRDTWLSEQFRAWNIEDAVKMIKCPLVAVQGKQDEYGTALQIERISQILPNPQQAKIVFLDNCRHATYKDQEEAVLSEIAGFLKGLENQH